MRSTRCTAAVFVQDLASVATLQTSSALLGSVIAQLNSPTNCTLFMASDAAWATFRAENGKLLVPASSIHPSSSDGAEFAGFRVFPTRVQARVH